MNVVKNVREMARKIPYARTVWRRLRALRGKINIDAAKEDFGDLKAYQIAALKEMPDVSIPSRSKAVLQLPAHVRGIVEADEPTRAVPERVLASKLGDLTNEEFEQLLAVRAMERALPMDILAEFFATRPKTDDPGHVHHFMSSYWRRLGHWTDIRDLMALHMRRKFDWNSPGGLDPVAVRLGEQFRNDGYAVLPDVLTHGQALEIQNYFSARPGLKTHVPDACPDPIRRYVGYGADDYSFCTYPFCDIMLAPHLLEALVNPRIAEIGLHGLGAIPRLWKIFTHWDLPGSKFLAHGTSIGHYHRDFNDVGMMWVYVYLTDVDRDCGPHGLVPGSQSVENITAWLQQAQNLGVDTRHAGRHLLPQDFFDGYGYQIRVEVKEAMFADREAVITGPAGTAFVSNGFNFHRIVTPQTKKRLLCAARYYLTEPKQLENPYRDTDKIPFGLVVDRIGDSELIREMTSGVVDWSLPRASRKMTGGKTESGKKYFLIVSNGRSGSTLLSTSLGKLSGVFADYEFRWALPHGAEGNPVHYVIPDHQATVAERLDAFPGDYRVVGSKLTFSLEWTQRQSVFEKLALYFDSNVNYVFLTRSYIETLASFLLRGPVHDLARPEGEAEKNNVMLGQLRAVFDQPATGQRSFHGNEWDVFRALRSLVNNDVIGYGICCRNQNMVSVSYDRIASDFWKVACAVGWDGNEEEARKAIEKPLVKKLPKLDYLSFPKAEVFASYSRRLNETLQKAIDEKWAAEVLNAAQQNNLDELQKHLAGNQ